MLWIYLMVSADVIVGLVVAVIAWIARRRDHVSLPLGLRVATLVVGVVALVATILFDSWWAWPFWRPFPFSIDSWIVIRMVSLALPLVLALLIVLGLMWPVGRRIASGVADLSPRTITTFARPRWLGGLAAIVAAVVAVAVVAGTASQPDEQGRYLSYWVEVARETRAGTGIYGWYFSVPCLAVVVVLLIAAAVTLKLISRPPFGADRELETRVRRLRTRNVLAAVSGGLLLHLGAVLESLAATASMSGGFNAGDLGTVTVGTPFAALGPALTGAGFIVSCLGFALWWLVLLSAIPLRRRVPRAVPA